METVELTIAQKAVDAAKRLRNLRRLEARYSQPLYQLAQVELLLEHQPHINANNLGAIATAGLREEIRLARLRFSGFSYPGQPLIGPTSKDTEPIP